MTDQPVTPQCTGPFSDGKDCPVHGRHTQPVTPARRWLEVGSWMLFTDDYGRVWKLNPTGEHDMPIRIELDSYSEPPNVTPPADEAEQRWDRVKRYLPRHLWPNEVY